MAGRSYCQGAVDSHAAGLKFEGHDQESLTEFASWRGAGWLRPCGTAYGAVFCLAVLIRSSTNLRARHWAALGVPSLLEEKLRI